MVEINGYNAREAVAADELSTSEVQPTEYENKLVIVEADDLPVGEVDADNIEVNGYNARAVAFANELPESTNGASEQPVNGYSSLIVANPDELENSTTGATQTLVNGYWAYLMTGVRGVPNRAELIQYLGKTYESDGLHYQKDFKGDQLRTVHEGSYGTFNGTDNQVVTSSDITDEWDITISATIPSVAPATDGFLFAKGSGAGTSTDIGLDIRTDSTIRAFYYNGTTPYQFISNITSYMDGQEHEIRFRRVGDNITVDIDGDNVISETQAINPNDSADTVYIGGRFSSLYYAGGVGYFKLNDSFEYDFEEQIGTTLLDKSGNDNHGTISGTMTNFWDTSIEARSYKNENGYNIDTDGSLTGTAGAYIPRLETTANLALPIKQQTDIFDNVLQQYGRARLDSQWIESSLLNFNGTDNFVQLGSSSDFDITGDYSISALIDVDDEATDRGIYCTGTGQMCTLRITAAGIARLYLRDSSLNFIYRDTTFNFEGKGLYRITAVYHHSAATIEMYVNKELNQGSLLGGAINDVVFADNTNIGARDDGASYVFKKNIGEVQLFRKALTQTDVNNLVDNVTVDGAIRHIVFGAGSGTVVYDKVTGNTYDIEGTLTDVWDTSDEQRPNNLLDGFTAGLALNEAGNGDWIDTDLTWNSTTILTIDGIIDPASAGADKLFGAASGGYHWIGAQAGSLFYAGYGTTFTNFTTPNTGQRTIFKFDTPGKTVSVGDEVKTFTANITGGDDILIGTMSPRSAPLRDIICTLFNVKIEQSGSVVMELVPQVDGTFLDTVSGDTFYNEGDRSLRLVRIPAKEGSITLDCQDGALTNLPTINGHNGAESKLRQPDAPELYAVPLGTKFNSDNNDYINVGTTHTSVDDVEFEVTFIASGIEDDLIAAGTTTDRAYLRQMSNGAIRLAVGAGSFNTSAGHFNTGDLVKVKATIGNVLNNVYINDKWIYTDTTYFRTAETNADAFVGRYLTSTAHFGGTMLHAKMTSDGIVQFELVHIKKGDTMGTQTATANGMYDKENDVIHYNAGTGELGSLNGLMTYGYEDMEADYNDAHYNFNNVFTKAPTKYNSLMYKAQQTGDDLDKIYKFEDDRYSRDETGQTLLDEDGNPIILG